METITVVIVSALAAVITGVVVYALMRQRVVRAREALDEALHQIQETKSGAERERKEALVLAKEEALALRERDENELREKRQALDRLEEKLTAKDESIEARRTRLEEREYDLDQRNREIIRLEEGVLGKVEEAEILLQRLSGLDSTQAREVYLAKIEEDFREIGLRRAREIECQTVAEAERRARAVILDVMERCAVEYVTEATVSVIMLPTEEMKGRIIGREGRNIRAFEQVTGVDLIIDDTPEAVVISCFDPIRRETARLALMNLMVDGRIHPGRIEELYEKAQEEVQRTIREAGERAAERAEVTGLPRMVVEMMGRLRFRTSYAQNVLDHSVEVAHLAVLLAHELGLNVEVCRRAGFLHDIGKALGPEWEGPHALTGMEFLRQLDIKEPILHAVGAHHHDIPPSTPEAVATIVADSLSAARPGARRENLENYVKRLASLETLANSFPGVERSYALQAGREVRLIVKPERVDDLAAAKLASEVARRIESEMEYPGQIKVTVIRETRSSDIAK